MNGREWTLEELTLLKELYPNPLVGGQEIARTLGRSYCVVRNKARSLGMPAIRIKDMWTEQEVKLLLELYPNPETLGSTLEATFNRTIKAVHLKAKAMGLKWVRRQRTPKPVGRPPKAKRGSTRSAGRPTKVKGTLAEGVERMIKGSRRAGTELELRSPSSPMNTELELRAPRKAVRIDAKTVIFIPEGEDAREAAYRFRNRLAHRRK